MERLHGCPQCRFRFRGNGRFARSASKTRFARGPPTLDTVDRHSFSTNRLPNTTSLRIHGIPAEVVYWAHSTSEGVCVSAGSACSSGSIKPQPCAPRDGLQPRQKLKQCLRISWGRHSTSDDIDTAARLVINHVTRIRTRTKHKR